jgi:hypothetical protein
VAEWFEAEAFDPRPMVVFWVTRRYFWQVRSHDDQCKIQFPATFCFGPRPYLSVAVAVGRVPQTVARIGAQATSGCVQPAALWSVWEEVANNIEDRRTSE